MSGAPPQDADAEYGPVAQKLRRGEEFANLAVLCLMALLPLLEMVGRPLGGRTIPGSAQYVSLLTLWIGFMGAALAARDQRHLSLATGLQFFKGNADLAVRIFRLVVASSITAVLARGAWLAVEVEMDSTETIPGGIPVWISQVAMPVGYGLVALRLIWSGFKEWRWRALSYALVVVVLIVAHYGDYEFAEKALWPSLALILAATVLGSPIFAALGGAALMLFWADDTPVAAVAAETVRQIKSPTMPTIPLFTFAGYLLAESGASSRLVRFTDAWVGWMPGGGAIMTAIVCAFFTTFTGASGVTILALGGLLYPMLIKDGYPEKFSVGLLTASGSIGLLFPPALPVIFYGVIAKVPVDRMFVAGLLPGTVLVLAVAMYGSYTGIKSGAVREKFVWAHAKSALWEAKWELVMPIVVLGGILMGWTTLVEAAALTAAYAFLVEVVIHKDLKLGDLPRVGRECATLIGGVLIILGVAMGLTSYLVDAEVPAIALEWVENRIESKYVFLIALNIFLLIVGCLMDIFSAIVVVVPLILPIGEHFGINPIHLGVIFLANLELGFLTPPVGMNLFLSSYRFDKPLTEVYRAAIPFLLILMIAVLLITYIPALTLAPVDWIFGDIPQAPEIKW